MAEAMQSQHNVSSRHTTPITIITGFLGAGKTTVLLKLVPQLPLGYKLALLKNEFGDLAIDSQLASAQAIAGVDEILNGCICCNLVGQLGDALNQLKDGYHPDRIVIETSGSAFPATLAMEVNRLARESVGTEGQGQSQPKWMLDGVINVIDVENWQGYEDTSVTAKMQARYTDLIIFNKWEAVSERRFEDCLDRLGDLDVQTAYVKSDHGLVGKDLVLGVDGALARELNDSTRKLSIHVHDHTTSHQTEVEVLSASLQAPEGTDASSMPIPGSKSAGVDLEKLQDFLLGAPKDEIYRIKAVLYATSPPASSTGEEAKPADTAALASHKPLRYILNWAFSRWTYTAVSAADEGVFEPPLKMTIVCARDESSKWKKRLEDGSFLAINGLDDMSNRALLKITRVS